MRRRETGEGERKNHRFQEIISLHFYFNRSLQVKFPLACYGTSDLKPRQLAARKIYFIISFSFF